MRPGGRTVGGLLLAACLLVAAGSTADASPRSAGAPAAPSGAPCPTADGVTVVVDFQGEGGKGLVVGCAPGAPSSGFDALKKAGFTVTPLSGGAPFLCRIDGQPSPDTGEDCVGYPPTSAYWGYFHAPRGGSWTYASEGAGTRRPPAGSVDGWSFQRNPSQEGAIRPRTDPPPPVTTTTARPAPTPTTRAPSVPTTTAPRNDPGATPTTTGPTPGPASPDDGPRPTVAGANPVTPRADGTDSAAATDPSGTTPSGDAAGSTTTSDRAGADDSPDDGSRGDEQAGVELAQRDDPGGPPTGALVGGAAVLALGAATAATARRRRADEAGGDVLPPAGPGPA